MAYDTFTLTGTHREMGGSSSPGPAHAGEVVVTANVATIRDSSGAVVLAGPVTEPLDGSGSWSMELPADDPTLNPSSGLVYTIRYRLDGAALPDQTLPAQAAGTTKDVADIVDEVASDGTVTVSLVGPAGPNVPQPGGLMARAVKGLFTVSQPSASGMTTGFYALAMDPNVPGRVWGNGRDFSTFGYYEPATNTYVAKTLHPGTGAMHELQFSIASGGGATSYAWLMTGANASRDGQLWRSPLPDANGNGLVWTKVLDLSAMPGGLTSGANSCFRPQCFAVAQNGASWHVHALEYSIAAGVTGGPSYYYSPDAGATWTKPKTWANAKHGHSVYVINGAPVVMLGDAGFAELGLWRATSMTGAAWSPRISKTLAQGGNELYGIGAVAGTLNGNPVLFFEPDTDEGWGLLVFPGGATTAQIWSLRPAYRMPSRYFGTVRSLTPTPASDLIYVVTTEDGAFGTHDDTVWISKADEHTAPVLCGSLGPPSSRPYGRAVSEGNGYVWFGDKRCHVEEFAT